MSSDNVARLFEFLRGCEALSGVGSLVGNARAMLALLMPRVGRADIGILSALEQSARALALISGSTPGTLLGVLNGTVDTLANIHNQTLIAISMERSMLKITQREAAKRLRATIGALCYHRWLRGNFCQTKDADERDRVSRVDVAVVAGAMTTALYLASVGRKFTESDDLRRYVGEDVGDSIARATFGPLRTTWMRRFANDLWVVCSHRVQAGGSTLAEQLLYIHGEHLLRLIPAHVDCETQAQLIRTSVGRLINLALAMREFGSPIWRAFAESAVRFAADALSTHPAGHQRVIVMHLQFVARELCTIATRPFVGTIGTHLATGLTSWPVNMQSLIKRSWATPELRMQLALCRALCVVSSIIENTPRASANDILIGYVRRTLDSPAKMPTPEIADRARVAAFAIPSIVWRTTHLALRGRAIVDRRALVRYVLAGGVGDGVNVDALLDSIFARGEYTADAAENVVVPADEDVVTLVDACIAEPVCIDDVERPEAVTGEQLDAEFVELFAADDAPDLHAAINKLTGGSDDDDDDALTSTDEQPRSRRRVSLASQTEP